MSKPSFINLWVLYPGEDHPCDGPWDNQCAIRMSVALNAEGHIRVDKGTYSEPKCNHGHARGAQSLATWLRKYHLGRPKIYTNGANAKSANISKTGIIFFKDCFSRDGITRTGDHIDLWLFGQTKGFRDPHNRSAQVWFWEII